jgi:hypothetical protein
LFLYHCISDFGVSMIMRMSISQMSGYKLSNTSRLVSKMKINSLNIH